MILNSPYISGSLTVTGNIIASGSITLSGSVASASYAANASNAVNASTASFVALAQSASYAVVATTASFADALTVAGTLTAQTLVVQTITSSVDFVTGSTRFGSILGNTHVFSGSVSMNPGGLFVSSSGRVGIGTTTPSSLFHVSSGTVSTPRGGGFSKFFFTDNNVTTTYFEIQTPTGSAGDILFSDGNSGDYGIIGYDHSTDSMRIYAKSDIRMFISGSGNVGIGTTTPIYQLDISTANYKSFRISSSDDALITMGSTVASSQFYSIGVSSNTSGQGSNLFWIGTSTNNPSGTLTKNLTINSSGAATFNSSITGTRLFTGNLGISMSGYGSLTQTVSGQMTILGHNVIADASAANTVIVSNSGWYSSMIKLYYSEGITFHTSPTVYNAGDTYPLSATERMRISSTGIVTKPNQPAFRAGRSSSYQPGANTPIVFNSTSGFGFNVGGHYNTSNGRFTAPVNGIYNFTACVIWQDLGSGQQMDDAFEVKVNGTTAAYSFRRAAYVANTTGNGGYYVDHATVLLNLTAGQYVEIQNRYNLTVHGNQNYCYFTGYLVG